MRLMTLLFGSTLLVGCVGTRVMEIDTTNEADRYTLVEASQAQSGEIMTDGDAVRFKKNQLRVTRDSLWVMPRGRRSEGQTSVPLSDGPVEVRFRYRGSPLGALIGALAGTGFGYLTATSCAPDCGFAVGFGLLAGGPLLGAVVGAFVGPKKTTIYRFRPDTPQQMSVVIGVGPAASSP